jgi:uncharacterized RDD family membrane protein YckC
MSSTPVGRAGVVTRALAAAVDIGLVVGVSVLLYVAGVGVLFAWSPLTFRWPTPPGWLPIVVFAGVAAFYLMAAWADTGRTRGGSLLGIRVVSTRGEPLGWPRAGARALAYVVFPLGLLWSALSPTRRSLQDVLVRSIVVYDWHRDGGARLAGATNALAEPRPDA